MPKPRVNLTIRQNRCYFKGAVDDDLLKNVARYRPKGYKYDWRYKNKLWDGWETLYTRANGKRYMPAGLYARAAMALEDSGYEVTIKDTRDAPAASQLTAEDVRLVDTELYPQQVEAIDAILQMESGIIKASTGFGKTMVIAGLIYARGLPTLVMVPSKSLLHETSERLEKLLDVPVGRIGDGLWNPGPVTVATFQTLAGRLKNEDTKSEAQEVLDTFDQVIVDECHHIGSGRTWLEAMNAIPAYYRVGVSATPFTNVDDGEEVMLVGATGEIVYDYRLADAIDDGISVKPYVFMLKYQTEKVFQDVDMPPYAQLYEAGILNCDERNQKIIDACRAAEKAKLPTVVIVDRVAQGEALAEALGWKFISGKTMNSTRTKARNDVNRGHIPGIVTTVMSEGIDIPNLACIVLAAGGRANHKLVQRIGRGVRRGIHEHCIIFDFYDQAHGVFIVQSNVRMKVYEAEEIPYKLVTKVPDLTKKETIERFAA